MKNIGNRAIFVAIPILMIFLLVFNAEYQARAYHEKLNKNQEEQLKAVYQIAKNEYRAKAGERFEIPVRVINKGNMPWTVNNSKQTNLSYHLYDTNNKLVLFDGVRTRIVTDIQPNQTVNFQATVQAPTQVGVYIIKFDMVCEGVAWFSERGSAMRQVILIVK